MYSQHWKTTKNRLGHFPAELEGDIKVIIQNDADAEMFGDSSRISCELVLEHPLQFHQVFPKSLVVNILCLDGEALQKLCLIPKNSAWFLHANLLILICFIPLAPVFQRLDGTIYWIKLYPMDNAIHFAITYLLDSILSPLYNWALEFISLGTVKVLLSDSRRQTNFTSLSTLHSPFILYSNYLHVNHVSHMLKGQVWGWVTFSEDQDV